MSFSGGFSDYGLETIEVKETGAVVVPETRMRSAEQVQSFGRRLWSNDELRSKKRSRVNGLVGGFPPYRSSKMRDAGLANNCNANFGTARAYMENAAGAFYDLFSEAPGVINIRTSHGDDEQRDEWSRVMSEEADRIIAKNRLFDYEMQRSQWEMVLHGCGPLFWEDAYRVFPRAVACGDFKVPERTKSDIEYYDIAWADVDFYPPQLYDFIKDKEPATLAGWDVDFTQRCIANAMDIRQPEQRAYDWEFYQQEIKNQSLSYYDDSKVCHLGFCWFKEFDGKITQVIVEREATTGPATDDLKNNPDQEQVKYLFQHIGRYDSFQQAFSSMYYDRGDGGYHHSVTGLGVRMYSPMEFENRLLCRLMDGAFAPKVLFRPTTAEASQKMQLAVLGDHGVMSPGYEAVQSPISGFINEGLSMYRASSDLMRSNLSSYRQQVETQKPGNPETKYGRQLDAAQQSSLSKTTFNRYYKQLDGLYSEMVRRMCNLNSPDRDAKTFQAKCQERGVPRECFGRLEAVEAVRVVGEGSAFLRKSSLTEMLQTGLVARFPEDGQANWTNDCIAAIAGQKSVTRYNPSKHRNKLPNDQQDHATLQVAAMKVGSQPVVTSTQNALTHAGIFLSACVNAIQSVKQGANPAEVVKFVDLAGPACIVQLKRIANDPLRKQAVMAIGKQIQQVMKMSEQLKKMIAQKQEQAKAQQQKAQAVMSDGAIKAMKVVGDLKLKQQKQQATLGMQEEKHRQGLALADATTASQIHNQNRVAAFSE